MRKSERARKEREREREREHPVFMEYRLFPTNMCHGKAGWKITNL